MQCKSCKNDIPPKFIHAISVNICPLCGQGIMDAELQSILNELKSVMDKSDKYKDEVSDWLFSNYGLKKSNNQNASNQQDIFDATKPGINVEQGQLLPEKEEMSVFAKRAGLKPENFKKVIEHIQSADISEFQGIDDEYGDVNSTLNDVELDEQSPINRNESKALMSIFKEDDAKALELEKLKRLNTKLPSSGGMFRRTS